METIKQFNSPEEELSYLREQVVQKEKQLAEKGQELHRPNVINETVEAYKKELPEQVLTKDMHLSHMHKEAIVLDLAPEPHDEKMGELLSLLQEKGVLNTIAIVERLNDPHIEDDFHRFLVQYIKQGLPDRILPEKNPLVRSLKYVLYEVSLPDVKKEDEEKGLKEMISSMEQFYSGCCLLKTLIIGGITICQLSLRFLLRKVRNPFFMYRCL